jgi:hypothetical protein
VKIVTTGRNFRSWFVALQHTARPDNPDVLERDLADLRFTQTSTFLTRLAQMSSAPDEDDPPFLKRIRQRTRYQLWRLGHPYHPEICVRLIVHFHRDAAVVALVGGDKRGVSDQWYDTASRRAEQDLDQYYRLQEGTP